MDVEELESENMDEEDNDKSPPPLGNGGQTDKYTWTQTLSELTVNVSLAAYGGDKIKSRDIKVSFHPESLSITIDGKVHCSGPLHSKIHSSDCTWVITDDRELGRLLTLSMHKVDKMAWWKCILKGDPEINTKKIQPENSKLDDLEGETRQTVEKMMWKQRTDAAAAAQAGGGGKGAMQMPFGGMGGMGDEEKKKDALKRFMEQHPEMDFSQAKINWG